MFTLVILLVYYISVATVGSTITAWTNDVLIGDINISATEGILPSID